VSVESEPSKSKSFASIADNLPRMAAPEVKVVKPAELAAAATASVLAAVPTNDAALAKPSIMTPPPSPTVEAVAKVEPAQPEAPKPAPSVIPDPRPADSVSREEIASLLRRGQDMIATGDIASGRLFLTRAALAGDAEASLALAGTYDPAVLANLKAVGVQPDLAKARAWYTRAAEQGSQEAKMRLQQSALR
jgi:TPR repeat protein